MTFKIFNGLNQNRMKFLQKMNPISFLNNRIFNKFGGRLGNNITQLANIIVIAIAYKHNIKFNVTPLNI